MSAILGEWATQLLAFVSAHEAWAAPICFVLAFAESLAFVSFVVPSTVMLVGVGALIGASELSFVEIWIGTALGACLGDWLSYWLGRRFGPAIGRKWPFNRYPTLLPRGQAFVERWGVPGIALGRFFGPLRAITPLVAGMCAMPFWKFQVANVGSAALWAFVILAPGALGARWLPSWIG